jgi:hypothetical protein
LVPRYWPAREAEASTAEPRKAAGPATRARNAWSKPNCSSAGTISDGLHTQRSQVRMHPDGHGWALASTTAAGAGAPRVGAGSGGAAITRLARTPGIATSLMAT